jgi:hypothetical protein
MLRSQRVETPAHGFLSFVHSDRMPDVCSLIRPMPARHITAWQLARRTDHDDLYHRLWNSRSRLLSVAMSRQQRWANDPRAEVQALYEQYRVARQKLNALEHEAALQRGSRSLVVQRLSEPRSRWNATGRVTRRKFDSLNWRPKR